MKTLSLTRFVDSLDQILSQLRNRHFLALDVIAFCVTAWVALWIRLEGIDVLGDYAKDVAVYVLAATVLRWLVFIPMGVYSRFWLQASIDELGTIVLSVLTATVLILLAFFGGLRPLGWISEGFPRSIPLIDGVLVLIAIGGSRYSVRWMERVQQRLHNRSLAGARVVVIGAGQAGAMIVREMQTNPQLGLLPVAFIDADRWKHGTRIQGVPVVGGDDRLRSVVQDYKVQQAIVAMPTAPGKRIRELMQKCRALNLPVKTIPGMFEILDGSVTVNQLRPIEIIDLLRREPINIEMTQVITLLQAKRVLVTGAGGSIGSELCRQIARCNPASLILLGHGENAIYEIANELEATHRQLKIQRVVADVRDADRLEKVFAQHKPQIVFHAAAHKHVPLMEENIADAISTNIKGTQTILAVSARTGVSHFVFISTDKAVNPTSVMGVTKRVAEMLVHQAAEHTGRCFLSVRFGNVLGSRGSVVPLFEQQIARGGPVTVTHPEARRYFMTIPESVQLVLQAATMGKGGETFVLDMGEPVKIVDLASDLIRLSGLEVGKDIEITFTGLRPGDKLSEELFFSDEMYTQTTHPKIFASRNGATPAHLFAPSALDERVAQLIEAARADDTMQIIAHLQALVPEYLPASLSSHPMSAGMP